ncbi:MAG TPA: hypothetical protein VF244_02830 [Acidimicrobiales bacterium]
MSTEPTSVETPIRRSHGLVIYEDDEHTLVLTDRMRAIQAAMRFDIFDYILEAFFVSPDDGTTWWGVEDVTRVLIEDSHVWVAVSTVRRWMVHGLMNDWRPDHFNAAYWRKANQTPEPWQIPWH